MADENASSKCVSSLNPIFYHQPSEYMFTRILGEIYYSSLSLALTCLKGLWKKCLIKETLSVEIQSAQSQIQCKARFKQKEILTKADRKLSRR